MMNRLNEAILCLQDIVAANPSGIMKLTVENQLAENYHPDFVRRGIGYVLDNLLVQQVLDEPSKESGILDDSVWYLKPLHPDTTDKLNNLKPRSFALVRLLHEQDSPKRRGQMPIDPAKNELRRRGIEYNDMEYIWIEGLIDAFFAHCGDKSVMWVRLVPEYETTEDYRKDEERLYREWTERDAFRMKMIDEIEKEERKRKKRRKQKQKKGF